MATVCVELHYSCHDIILFLYLFALFIQECHRPVGALAISSSNIFQAFISANLCFLSVGSVFICYGLTTSSSSLACPVICGTGIAAYALPSFCPVCCVVLFYGL